MGVVEQAPNDPRRAEINPFLKLALELGPLAVFFFANARFGIFAATATFMVVTTLSLAASWLLTRRLAIMPLVTGIVVFVFGGLTLFLQDETFIKMKPTLYYVLVAAILGFGLATGKPLLKAVLGSTYPGLDQHGWVKLTRNWALFFAGMAVLNESVWRNSSTEFWIGFKIWGAIPLTFLFALANVPMLMKHGLMGEEAKAEEPGPVE